MKAAFALNPHSESWSLLLLKTVVTSSKSRSVPHHVWKLSTVSASSRVTRLARRVRLPPASRRMPYGLRRRRNVFLFYKTRCLQDRIEIMTHEKCTCSVSEIILIYKEQMTRHASRKCCYLHWRVHTRGKNTTKYQRRPYRSVYYCTDLHAERCVKEMCAWEQLNPPRRAQTPSWEWIPYSGPAYSWPWCLYVL